MPVCCLLLLCVVTRAGASSPPWVTLVPEFVTCAGAVDRSCFVCWEREKCDLYEYVGERQRMKCCGIVVCGSELARGRIKNVFMLIFEVVLLFTS